MIQFKQGQSYGNDLTVEVLKRTPKTATIKTVFGEQRVKVKVCPNRNIEYISYKCWLIESVEDFDDQEATRIALEKAYFG